VGVCELLSVKGSHFSVKSFPKIQETSYLVAGNMCYSETFITNEVHSCSKFNLKGNEVDLGLVRSWEMLFVFCRPVRTSRMKGHVRTHVHGSCSTTPTPTSSLPTPTGSTALGQRVSRHVHVRPGYSQNETRILTFFSLEHTTKFELYVSFM